MCIILKDANVKSAFKCIYKSMVWSHFYQENNRFKVVFASFHLRGGGGAGEGAVLTISNDFLTI